MKTGERVIDTRKRGKRCEKGRQGETGQRVRKHKKDTQINKYRYTKIT